MACSDFNCCNIAEAAACKSCCCPALLSTHSGSLQGTSHLVTPAQRFLSEFKGQKLAALPHVYGCRLAVWRFTAYGRLQYITAAMLGRWVPKGMLALLLSHRNLSNSFQDTHNTQTFADIIACNVMIFLQFSCHC